MTADPRTRSCRYFPETCGDLHGLRICKTFTRGREEGGAQISVTDSGLRAQRQSIAKKLCSSLPPVKKQRFNNPIATTSMLWLSSRQRERHDPASWRRSQETVAAGSHHNVLTVVAAHERHRRGVRAGVERRFPQQRAGLRVEGTEALVDRRTHEQDAARRHDGAADVRRSGLVEAARLQLVEDAERHAPGD